jgi:PIN domain nuclease of toxin-antitoxin system
MWTITDARVSPRKLATPSRRSHSRVFVSGVINGWEIAVKKSLGKMAVPDDMEARITRACGGAGFDLLPVELRHAFEVQSLPLAPQGSVRSLLVAQARVERPHAGQHRRAVRAYAVDVLW